MELTAGIALCINLKALLGPVGLYAVIAFKQVAMFRLDSLGH